MASQHYHLWKHRSGAAIIELLRRVEHWYDGNQPAHFENRKTAEWYARREATKGNGRWKVMVRQCWGACPQPLTANGEANGEASGGQGASPLQPHTRTSDVARSPKEPRAPGPPGPRAPGQAGHTGSTSQLANPPSTPLQPTTILV